VSSTVPASNSQSQQIIKSPLGYFLFYLSFFFCITELYLNLADINTSIIGSILLILVNSIKLRSKKVFYLSCALKKDTNRKFSMYQDNNEHFLIIPDTMGLLS
jgi:hypothetical protein